MIIKNIPSTGNKCVYVHRRKTDGIVFYIGIGSMERSKTKWGRNDHWKKVVAKHGYEIDYLAQNVSIEEAKEIEIEAIKYYRDKVGDKLTNKSDGGEGTYGLTGEKSSAFKGYWLFYNLDAKVYWLCNGAKELDTDGFDRARASGVKSKKYDYLTSNKIHKDGVKIRFQVIQSEDADALVNFIDENKLIEAELCEVEIEGRVVENYSNFRAHYVGTSDSKIILITGNKMAKENHFSVGNLNTCVSGGQKTAYGYTWVRTLDLDQFKSTTLTPANDYTAQLLQA